MIKFKLAEMLENRGKTMYWLSKETGVRPNTISQWVNNEQLDEDKKVKSISVEVLDKFCIALNCKIEDLLTVVKN
ncbi:helix-turn-helix transcriptional regulator [Bacillus sp. S13(2024)]|uniref:helix-turn-helix domain-containing protein n=1 Tax=Bacillus sp. S13(2024) TaxID=3162885 RepID=UPI003D218B29